MQGHIHKRTRKRRDGRTTSSWYVVVDRGRTPDGKRKQQWHGGFSTRREAEVARAKIVSDINDGSYVAPAKRTFGEFVRDDWLPAMRGRLKATTFDSYSRTLDLHVLPALDCVALSQVTPSKLNTLYGSLLPSEPGGPGLSARSVSYVHRIVHKALADAAKMQLISQNAADRAMPPRASRSTAETMRCWTPAQLREFLALTRDSEWNLLWRLAAMTGMRRGELIGLSWDDVDLPNRRLSVRRSIVSIAYQVQTSTPKSHRARVVDLDVHTATLLGTVRLSATSPFVFARADGSPHHPDRVTKAFNQAVRRSGLDRIRFHDLRHTHATIALAAGVPVKVISERLGHESPAFTLRQYAHVLPGMQAQAAEAIATRSPKTLAPPDNRTYVRPGRQANGKAPDERGAATRMESAGRTARASTLSGDAHRR